MVALIIMAVRNSAWTFTHLYICARPFPLSSQ